jgi:hypothetical protein
MPRHRTNRQNGPQIFRIDPRFSTAPDLEGIFKPRVWPSRCSPLPDAGRVPGGESSVSILTSVLVAPRERKLPKFGQSHPPIPVASDRTEFWSRLALPVSLDLSRPRLQFRWPRPDHCRFRIRFRPHPRSVARRSSRLPKLGQSRLPIPGASVPTQFWSGSAPPFAPPGPSLPLTGLGGGSTTSVGQLPIEIECPDPPLPSGNLSRPIRSRPTPSLAFKKSPRRMLPRGR